MIRLWRLPCWFLLVVKWTNEISYGKANSNTKIWRIVRCNIIVLNSCFFFFVLAQKISGQDLSRLNTGKSWKSFAGTNFVKASSSNEKCRVLWRTTRLNGSRLHRKRKSQGLIRFEARGAIGKNQHKQLWKLWEAVIYHWLESFLWEHLDRKALHIDSKRTNHGKKNNSLIKELKTAVNNLQTKSAARSKLYGHCDHELRPMFMIFAALWWPGICKPCLAS